MLHGGGMSTAPASMEKVRSAALKRFAAQVRSAVGQPLRHPIEGRLDTLVRRHGGGGTDAELVHDQARDRGIQWRQEPSLPCWHVARPVGRGKVSTGEDVVVHPQAALWAEVLVEVALERADLLARGPGLGIRAAVIGRPGVGVGEDVRGFGQHARVCADEHWVVPLPLARREATM